MHLVGSVRSELVTRGYLLDSDVMVHRRDLVARCGGWDTDLVRMVDWDIALRFTVEKPARPLAVLGRNIASAAIRASHWRFRSGRQRWPFGANGFHRPCRRTVQECCMSFGIIRSSARPMPRPSSACMRRWGVHVEVWCTSAGASLYPTDVTIHRGSLAAAVEAARPDVIHVHWLGFANMRRDELAAAGLPGAVRAHGFDTTRDSLAAWLANDFRCCLCIPGQIARCGIDDGRLKPTPVGFDTRLFKPWPDKDRATGGADLVSAAVQGPRVLFRGGANVAGLSFRAGGGHLPGRRGVCGRTASHA